MPQKRKIKVVQKKQKETTIFLRVTRALVVSSPNFDSNRLLSEHPSIIPRLSPSLGTKFIMHRPMFGTCSSWNRPGISRMVLRGIGRTTVAVAPRKPRRVGLMGSGYSYYTTVVPTETTSGREWASRKPSKEDKLVAPECEGFRRPSPIAIPDPLQCACWATVVQPAIIHPKRGAASSDTLGIALPGHEISWSFFGITPTD